MKKNIITDPKSLSESQNFKFYMPVAMLFVSILITVNIIVQKVIPAGWGLLTAADIFYPLSYVISVILTEVYGYALSRRVIWCAFACNLMMALIMAAAVALPAISTWHYQAEFSLIIGRAPRIVCSSLTAFAFGEFINSYTIAKMKIFNKGKYLWLRTASATVASQAVDTVLFVFLAFTGILPLREILIIAISTYLFKIIYETTITPLVYLITKFLKRQEGIDIYDKGTNFNPFTLALK